MFFENLFTGIRQLGRPAAATALHGLCSPSELRTILQRERERTDRSGQPFSVVTLSGDAGASDRTALEQATQILKRRMRLTDDAGWISARQIVVILPGTSIDGAWKFAGDICRSLRGCPRPICKVYCYPSDWSFDDDTPGRSTGRRRDEKDEKDVTPQPAPPQVWDGQPAGTLNAFFVQGLPVWKRYTDMVGACIGLVLLAPLFALVAAAVKLTSPGPVFFQQYRTGLGGRQFILYKFRSMNIDAESRKGELLSLNEQDGPAFKMQRDPRVTRLGQLLRKTSIDELPQLWNVLKGDMSLVGPRPLPCHETAGCRRWQHRRYDVTPGLTCTWQVSDRLKVSFADWVRMDVRYIRSRTLWGDLKLLLKTAAVLVVHNKGC